jgi:hypothetical protein
MGKSERFWPHGIDAVRATYGDIRPFIQQDFDRLSAPGWAPAKLTVVTLPAPLHYTGRPVRSIWCHSYIAPSLRVVLGRIWDAGQDAWDSLDPYGGCWCVRAIRGSAGPAIDHLSRHSEAIALDFGVSRNPRGQAWADFHPAVTSAFDEEGWCHGLVFATPDPMHWQACYGC